MREALFESWVISEILKWHRHCTPRAELSFYRKRDRHEIGMLIAHRGQLAPIEAHPIRRLLKGVPSGWRLGAEASLARGVIDG